MKLLKIMGLMLFALNAQAATYYVGTSGNDANSGVNLNYKIRHIQSALDRAVDGDKIYVTGGTYAEYVTVNQSNLTLAAFPGSAPVIDGATLPDTEWVSGIFVAGNYNLISGFEIKNINLGGTYQSGYGVQVYGHHNTIRNMKTHHNYGAGIIANGDYSIVEDSFSYFNSIRNQAGQMESGWGTGISAARNEDPAALTPGITSYPILRRNTVYNNYGEGVSCFETDNCIIDRNYVFDNWTVNVYLSDSTDGIVRNNLVYRSTNPAISFRAGSVPGITLSDEIANGTTIPYSNNNLVCNNLLYGNDLQAMQFSIVPSGLKNSRILYNTIDQGTLSTGIPADGITNVNSKLRNNIIVDPSSRQSEVGYLPGLTFSNNNWTNRPPLAAGTGDILTNPQLSGGATTPGSLVWQYFMLGSTSQDKNAGLQITGITNDQFGSARDSMPSIGGHEYGATMPTLTITNITHTTVTPGTVFVNYSVSKRAATRVEFGTTSTSFPYITNATGYYYNTGVSRGGLVSGATYYYRVVATDSITGVVATSAVYSFVMP